MYTSSAPSTVIHNKDTLVSKALAVTT